MRGGLVLFLGVGLYLVFGNSPEGEVLGVIRKAAAALGSLPGDTPTSRSRRLAFALQELTSPELTVFVPELGEMQGRQSVGAVLAGTEGIELQISIEGITVQSVSDRGARANLMAVVVLRTPGLERQERRTVQLRLERNLDAYRITRVDLGPASNEEPEARP